MQKNYIKITSLALFVGLSLAATAQTLPLPPVTRHVPGNTPQVPGLPLPKPPKAPKHLEVRLDGRDTITLWIAADVTETFTFQILNHKDSLLSSVPVSGGLNILPGLPYGHYHYELVSDSGVVKKGKFNVGKPERPRPPKPLEVRIKSKDTLTLWIGADVTETFTFRILNHDDSLLSTVPVNGGLNILPGLPYGHYHYELASDTGLVKKGKFDVRPKRVPSVVFPNPSLDGQASITLDLPATETFELKIYSAADLVQTVTITGGITQIPVLPSGLYHYKVVNSSGYVISGGKIIVTK